MRQPVERTPPGAASLARLRAAIEAAIDMRTEPVPAALRSALDMALDDMFVAMDEDEEAQGVLLEAVVDEIAFELALQTHAAAAEEIAGEIHAVITTWLAPPAVAA